MTIANFPPVSLARLGTRASALARWQTDHVKGLLIKAWPTLKVEIQLMQTKGDQILGKPLPEIGGKGLFTEELEQALRAKTIDFAVHSLKDLPTESPEMLTLGAIPKRANCADVLVSRNRYTLDTLPKRATLGTSSLRRAAQLLHYRPDLRIINIRGNVDTRVQKALDPAGPYDAILMAYAGLSRLDMLHVVSQLVPCEYILPAPGQGALAVQCRMEQACLELVQPLNHEPSQMAVEAERSFLAGLGGGCAVPIAAWATTESLQLHLRGRVTAMDGSKQIDVEASLDGRQGYDLPAVNQLGHDLAQKALQKGAAEILAAVTKS